MMDYRHEKLDIIVLAGQSNAEGFGVRTDDYIYTNGKMYELIDANNYFLDEKNGNCGPIRIFLPLQCKVQALQDRVTESGPATTFANTFAEEYVKAGLLASDRKIMVVKSAIGGTGFTLKQQGVNNPLSQRTKDMVALVKSWNPENRVVAYLWHQGEHDAFENKDLSYDERFKFYHDEFMAQINDFLKAFPDDKIPVLAGEFCNQWADMEDVKDRTLCIENCLRQCMKEIGLADMVSSEGLRSNDQILHNGDGIHFSGESCEIFGKRYFESYLKLIGK